MALLLLRLTFLASALNLPASGTFASVHERRARRQHLEISQQVLAQQADDADVAIDTDAGNVDAVEPSGGAVPSGAVDDAEASAEEVVKAAEQEEAAADEKGGADRRGNGPSTLLSKHAKVKDLKHIHSNNAVADETKGGFQKDDEAAADTETDAEDDADEEYDENEEEEEADEAPVEAVSVVTAAPVHGDILESYTPEGRYRVAKEKLQLNLKQQADNARMTTYLINSSAYESRVDSEADAIAAESNATALAAMLATVRKEMHKFASPFYLQYLQSENKRLRAEEPELQAEVEAARLALTTTTTKFLGAPPPTQPPPLAPVPDRASITIAKSSAVRAQDSMCILTVGAMMLVTVSNHIV
jgi:hypothetical protein